MTLTLPGMCDTERASQTIEYATSGTRRAQQDRLRYLSLASFITSLIGGVVTLSLLFVGIGMGGAGHGDWTIWYVGLLMWAISWLVMLVSCVAGIASWARSGRPAWWVIPAGLIVWAVGALGLWGLQG